MSQDLDSKQRAGDARKKLFLSLAINAIAPVVIYALVRPYVGSDAAGLAIAGAVPLARTLAVWAFKRRLDRIGALATLGFVLAFTASALLGGNAFVLKVHDSLFLGIAGLVLIVSAAIGKPLLGPVLEALSGSSPAVSREPGDNDHGSPRRKRLTLVTVLIGLTLVVDTAAHVILALTLPTGAFLAAAKLVNWSVLGGGILLVWLTRRPAGSTEA